MTRQDMGWGAALALSLVALLVAVFKPAGPAGDVPQPSALTEAQFRRELQAEVAKMRAALREELVNELELLTVMQEAKPSNELAELSVDPFSLMPLNMQTDKVVEKAILEKVAAQLDQVDWSKELDTEKIAKTLRRAARKDPFGFPAYERVDVDDIPEIEGKLDRILEEFDGVNAYSSQNPLVRQMSELGEEAISPLLDRLDEIEGHGQWARKSAIEEALGSLLGGEHEEIILYYFENGGHFEDLVYKHGFEAAEGVAMEKLGSAQGRVSDRVIDIALNLNESGAVPLLYEHVRTGQDVAYAAQRLAELQGEASHPALREAAEGEMQFWSKFTLAPVLMGEGLVEGLDLASDFLRSDHEHSIHVKDAIASELRKRTPARGNHEAMADWLETNRDTLRWNRSTGKFE